MTKTPVIVNMGDVDPKPNYRRILVQLISAIDLADHLGDVIDDTLDAMRQMGIPSEECGEERNTPALVRHFPRDVKDYMKGIE